jgi:hypothetical protein
MYANYVILTFFKDKQQKLEKNDSRKKYFTTELQAFQAFVNISFKKEINKQFL